MCQGQFRRVESISVDSVTKRQVVNTEVASRFARPSSHLHRWNLNFIDIKLAASVNNLLTSEPTPRSHV
jgi:hypothetical protein